MYAERDPEDGARILVDRVWPRGVRKEQAQADLWLKEAGPSAELRKRKHLQANKQVVVKG